MHSTITTFNSFTLFFESSKLAATSFFVSSTPDFNSLTSFTDSPTTNSSSLRLFFVSSPLFFTSSISFFSSLTSFFVSSISFFKPLIRSFISITTLFDTLSSFELFVIKRRIDVSSDDDFLFKSSHCLDNKLSCEDEAEVVS